MPSPATMLGTIATAVASLTSGTRLASDYRVDLAPIAAGALVYQIRGVTGGKSFTSGDERAVLAVRVDVHRRLSGGEAERAYTEVAMQTHLASLLSPEWWRALSGVADVAPKPSIDTDDVRRVGRVVSYSVTVGLVVTSA